MLYKFVVYLTEYIEFTLADKLILQYDSHKKCLNTINPRINKTSDF